MEDTRDISRMAEKVRRLLALANSANTHEAAAAAAKAQELLHKYNLTMADVSAQEKSDYKREMVEFYDTSSWRKVLLNAVTRNVGATTIDLGAERGCIIGQPHVIQVAKYLYVYLEREIERLCVEGWAEYTGYESSPRRWKTSFRFGAINAVNETLKAQYTKQKEESTTSTALVLVNEKALRAAVVSFYPRLRTSNIRSGNSNSGYTSGKVAGAGIRVSTGVGGGQRTPVSGRLK